MLKSGYRKLVKWLDGLSLKIRLKKQFVAEHLEVHKMNNSVPVKGNSLSNVQRKEIEEYWKFVYGKKIQTKWHQKYYGYSGNFDVRYFPEILYTTKLEPLMNPEIYTKVLADKNLIEMIFGSVLKENKEVVIPKTLCGCANGYYFGHERKPLTKQQVLDLLSKSKGKYIIKPTIGESSGRGVRLLDVEKGLDLLSKESISSIIEAYGRDFIIQERIKQNPEYELLHPKSINTIRIMTYRVDGGIRHVPAVMRIGVGDSHLDNAHAGGLYVGISDEGILQKKALRNYSSVYFEHPDTKIKFDGYQLPYFEKIIQAAHQLHVCLPSIGIVNWDFSMDEENKVVLIESNMGCGGIWLFQNAWGKAPFGNDTEYMINLIKDK